MPRLRKCSARNHPRLFFPASRNFKDARYIKRCLISLNDRCCLGQELFDGYALGSDKELSARRMLFGKLLHAGQRRLFPTAFYFNGNKPVFVLDHKINFPIVSRPVKNINTTIFEAIHQRGANSRFY